MKKKQLKKEVRKLNANSALLFDTAMERINMVSETIKQHTKELYDLRMTGNPTGTNAELRNTVARLQNRLKQMSVFNPSDNSFIVQQVADNTSRYKQLLDQAANDNQQLRNCIEELERKLAVPPADVTGYKDAFIDGVRYAEQHMFNPAGHEENNSDYELRSLYHERAVQRAVFPDVING